MDFLTPDRSGVRGYDGSMPFTPTSGRVIRAFVFCAKTDIILRRKSLVGLIPLNVFWNTCGGIPVGRAAHGALPTVATEGREPVPEDEARRQGFD